MSGLKPLSRAPKRVIRECFERARIYADGFAVFCVLMMHRGYRVPEGRYTAPKGWDRPVKRG